MGGLTCVRQMIRLLPGEDIVYFWRYGARAVRRTLGGDHRALCAAGCRVFAQFRPQGDRHRLRHGIHYRDGCAQSAKITSILGVVQPAAKAAVQATRTGNIGVIGTKATIRGGAYEASIPARFCRISPQRHARCLCLSSRTAECGAGTRSPSAW